MKKNRKRIIMEMYFCEEEIVYEKSNFTNEQIKDILYAKKFLEDIING